MSWIKKYIPASGALIAMMCIICTTTIAQSQNNRHRVKAGETLYSIASQYDLSIQQLKKMNNLEDNELSVGQTLIVRDDVPDEPVTHIVKAQETLFSISKMYGVTIPEIRAWNSLADNGLEVGQELVIYPHSASQQTSDSSSNTNSIVSNDAEQSNSYYTVKSGDTLYRIAREHAMTVSQLRELNDLTSDNISIGQQLTVKTTSAPPSVAGSPDDSSPQGKFVTYQATDSQPLVEVLDQFQMTRTEFFSLNPEFTGTKLKARQKVTVLAPPSRTYKNPYLTQATLKNLGEARVSRYSSSNALKTTTSGELYNPDELTAAHSNISMGTVLYVQNPANNKGIYIRINDRLSGKGLKLSGAAWQALGLTSDNPSVVMYQDQ